MVKGRRDVGCQPGTMASVWCDRRKGICRPLARTFAVCASALRPFILSAL